jgi:hypothetical protein
VCVLYYCFPYSIHDDYIIRCREIGNIQVHQRDVQDPGVYNLGPPVSNTVS